MERRTLMPSKDAERKADLAEALRTLKCIPKSTSHIETLLTRGFLPSLGTWRVGFALRPTARLEGARQNTFRAFEGGEVAQLKDFQGI